MSDEGGAILNETAREDFAEVPPERRPQGSKAADHANRRGEERFRKMGLRTLRCGAVSTPGLRLRNRRQPVKWGREAEEENGCGKEA